ncbi:MAG: response regulator [Pseudomonadales bacterium]
MDNPQMPGRVLTTGEIAKYCKVHFRTVIRWIDRGSLKAYKLPGRGNNRIEEKEFIRFLKENAMPIPTDFQTASNRILIVDDEQEMSASIQRILKRAGYETLIAQDGFQAGSMLPTFQPDLMTLDLSMPNMDGFSVLKYINNNAEYKMLKILVVSALSDEKLNEALAAGAHKTLAKPFKKSALLAVINELIGAAER